MFCFQVVEDTGDKGGDGGVVVVGCGGDSPATHQKMAGNRNFGDILGTFRGTKHVSALHSKQNKQM